MCGENKWSGSNGLIKSSKSRRAVGLQQLQHFYSEMSALWYQLRFVNTHFIIMRQNESTGLNYEAKSWQPRCKNVLFKADKERGKSELWSKLCSPLRDPTFLKASGQEQRWQHHFWLLCRALNKLFNELEEMDVLQPASITSAVLIRAEMTGLFLYISNEDGGKKKVLNACFYIWYN